MPLNQLLRSPLPHRIREKSANLSLRHSNVNPGNDGFKRIGSNARCPPHHDKLLRLFDSPKLHDQF